MQRIVRWCLFAVLGAALLLPAQFTLAAPRTGATLVFARQEETETLDPHKTTTISSAEVDYLIYDTLTSLDYDNTVKPGLAEKWEISPDGKTYTFTLRQGVRFHSGKPLTSADVKFTFDRWKTVRGSPTAFNIASVESVETPNPRTVVLRLREPLSILLINLAGYAASILNQEFTQRLGDDYGTGAGKVDGTGPFILREWVRNDRLVVARNPNYTWGPPVYKNQGPAKLDGVIFRTIVEDAPRVAAVEVGEAHFTPSIPPPQVARLTKEGRVKIIRYTDMNTAFIGFKLGKKPLDDVKVRIAINHGVNKPEIIAGVYYGLADEAYGPLAPNTPGWWKDVTKAGYRYNPSKAKRILDEAGWTQRAVGQTREKDGRPLSILFMYSPGPENESLVNLVQAQLSGIGVEVRPQRLEWTAFLAALRAGQHDMFLINVRYVTADVLYFYFHSKQRPAPNRFDWADPETDRLLELSRSSVKEEERLDAYRKLQQIVVENAIWVPLVHQKRVVMASPKLEIPRMHANVLYKMLDLELKP
ncbi:MAG: ABC transporter substrate-binding protein [Armatimonadota bacterium]|nr:ABC transporter substrate-binding protein [Armatimonadota bacterium]